MKCKELIEMIEQEFPMKYAESISLPISLTKMAMQL